MIKAHVFKYSQVILTKRELAIIKFSEYSGLSIPDIATMAKEEDKPTISYTLSYKLGNSGERELKHYTKHFLAARDYDTGMAYGSSK
ncbi:hypothetical protein [Rickettsia gravesii]|uniref:hypothetical protein n=1 Tax=Rickettsia gravesii TaxID=354585 RepID=UPI00036D0E70|nr:hypothetical protein [Rickettsia gravesii]